MSQEIYSGWVIKQGGTVKTWKRRWCVLNTNDEIRYYTNSNSTKLKGVIDLTQVLCFAVGVQTNSLTITTTSRTWNLTFDKTSTKNAEKWAIFLEKVLKNPKSFVTNHEGYMSKRGGQNTTLKRRYFALGKGWVFYFNGKEECDTFKNIRFYSERVFQDDFFKYVKGSIPLDRCEMIFNPHNHVQFDLKTRDRTFFLLGDNQADIDKWTDAIGAAITSEKEKRQRKKEARKNKKANSASNTKTSEPSPPSSPLPSSPLPSLPPRLPSRPPPPPLSKSLQLSAIGSKEGAESKNHLSALFIAPDRPSQFSKTYSNQSMYSVPSQVDLQGGYDSDFGGFKSFQGQLSARLEPISSHTVPPPPPARPPIPPMQGHSISMRMHRF